MPPLTEMIWPLMNEAFSFKPVSLVVAVQTGGRAPQMIGSGRKFGS